MSLGICTAYKGGGPLITPPHPGDKYSASPDYKRQINSTLEDSKKC